ncbi:hypothetical protein Sinac_2508 [Singulisphaera acidiphila DSM 18658]|uniref:Uncharacterized protein n=1 Tax=Singulisphaera acidiphila (strain ATCC BAA-1392 / DSM 18658 / VKM B-2454 / MOB10) TaxID=886293 RepID=L0DDS5_SINAD|nr:hypothetical protein Sinac_2508 [Singulisphaera acidiphila DSM 18658]
MGRGVRELLLLMNNLENCAHVSCREARPICLFDQRLGSSGCLFLLGRKPVGRAYTRQDTCLQVIKAILGLWRSR